MSIFLWTWLVGFHPFYVSMTEVQHRPKERKLEISVRIFTDDLEKDLSRHCQCKTDLLNPAMHDRMEPVLKNYLADVLKIKVEGKPVSPGWIGFEKEDESIWSYLEVENVTQPRSLEIENRILFATQTKQVNLVRFKTAAQDVTRQLSYPNSSVSF